MLRSYPGGEGALSAVILEVEVGVSDLARTLGLWARHSA